MNNGRKQLIIKAFQKLDKSGDNVVTVDDLKGVYNVTKHKKYISGEWSEDQCLREFLDSFDSPDNKDGQVRYVLFIHYVVTFYWTYVYLLCSLFNYSSKQSLGNRIPHYNRDDVYIINSTLTETST